MPPSPLASGQKLHCVSYAPFRGAQTPLDPTTIIPVSQIEQDLAQLAKLTECIRIYSVDLGLDRVPEIAEKYGLKVLLGIWISSEAKRNEAQIKAGVALANKYPRTIRAVVVGNEVILRGEMTAADLESHIRSVRAQVTVPVTYADVWECWLRNRQLAAAVDFVTVHILPYWEDIPIPAAQAASHITSIHGQVAAVFPGKDVLIGEAGWPSQGRMREGARPSPADQARVFHDLLSAANAHGFRVNLIEAYDQPWKRHLEGTVGGYWGLIDDAKRELKLVWGEPVSNHPYWKWQAALGLLFAGAIFAIAAWQPSPCKDQPESPADRVCVATVATVAGVTIGAAVEAALSESLGAGGWVRSLALVGLAILTPLAAAAALACRSPGVVIEHMIGLPERRIGGAVPGAVGWSLIGTCVLAMESALSLTFNPRYLDFPYASLTAAVVPLTILGLRKRSIGSRPAAETVIAAVLGSCALWIVRAEGFANWQALWLSALFLLLAFTLARVRVAPDST